MKNLWGRMSWMGSAVAIALTAACSSQTPGVISLDSSESTSAQTAIACNSTTCTSLPLPEPEPSVVPLPPPIDVIPADVEDIEVEILESFPPRVRVVARGFLPNPCYRLGTPRIRQVRNRIRVYLPAITRTDLICTQVLVEFEETIPLGTFTERGIYNVNVNGVSERFRL
ncbi:MAG: hypothetical protein HC921_04610 [Synechococcaceae cyanobacterium SM2_3_1]|nr:hypothetical protein [Synechococcaceae cyanobacterium SM2_3_1]